MFFVYFSHGIVTPSVIGADGRPEPLLKHLQEMQASAPPDDKEESD